MYDLRHAFKVQEDFDTETDSDFSPKAFRAQSITRNLGDVKREHVTSDSV